MHFERPSFNYAPSINARSDSFNCVAWSRSRRPLHLRRPSFPPPQTRGATKSSTFYPPTATAKRVASPPVHYTKKSSNSPLVASRAATKSTPSKRSSRPYATESTTSFPAAPSPSSAPKPPDCHSPPATSTSSSWERPSTSSPHETLSVAIRELVYLRNWRD